MIAMVMIAKIKKGAEAEFELGIAELFRLTAAEPGNVGCGWGTTEIVGEYCAWERYVDMEAFDAHRASAHVQDMGPSLMALFEGQPSIAHFVER